MTQLTAQIRQSRRANLVWNHLWFKDKINPVMSAKAELKAVISAMSQAPELTDKPEVDQW